MKKSSSLKSAAFFLLAMGLTAAQNAPAQHAEDPTYHGSSFNEVFNVLEDQNFTAENAQQTAEFDAYKNGALPRYPVSFRSLKLFALSKASNLTLKDRTDYYPRLEKLVHSSGVCVTGQWSISEQSVYSGFFQKDSQGLFIGRISTALEETTNAGNRGFGFAGKIFPTLNPAEKVPTTSFFTVDVLSGTPAKRFLDVAVTNNPPLHPSFDIFGVLSKIIPAFLQADSQPTFRPITQIARMAAAGAVKAPIYMRLRPSASLHKNDQADFRQEVLQAMQDNGHQLEFLIEVSDTTNDRLAATGWQVLGRIKLDRALVSYGCDRRLHFAHPKDDKSNKGVK